MNNSCLENSWIRLGNFCRWINLNADELPKNGIKVHLKSKYWFNYVLPHFIAKYFVRYIARKEIREAINKDSR